MICMETIIPLIKFITRMVHGMWKKLKYLSFSLVQQRMGPKNSNCMLEQMCLLIYSHNALCIFLLSRTKQCSRIILHFFQVNLVTFNGRCHFKISTNVLNMLITRVLIAFTFQTIQTKPENISWNIFIYTYILCLYPIYLSIM